MVEDAIIVLFLNAMKTVDIFSNVEIIDVNYLKIYRIIDNKWKTFSNNNHDNIISKLREILTFI